MKIMKIYKNGIVLISKGHRFSRDVLIVMKKIVFWKAPIYFERWEKRSTPSFIWSFRIVDIWVWDNTMCNGLVPLLLTKINLIESYDMYQ